MQIVMQHANDKQTERHERERKQEKKEKNYKQPAAWVYVVRAGKFGMNRVMNTRLGLKMACK